MRLRGMPVHLATTCKMSSSETTTRFSSLAVFQSASVVSAGIAGTRPAV